MAKAINRVGEVHGNFTILRQEIRNRVNYSLCLCSACGKEKWIRTDHVISGRMKTCGCGRISLDDRIGERHGNLTIIDVDHKKNPRVLCRCAECGKEKWKVLHWVLENHEHCGCKNQKDVKGQMFGHLEAIEPTDKRVNGSVVWKFKCHACGEDFETALRMVMQLGVKDCGCLYTKKMSETGKRVYENVLKPALQFNTNVRSILSDKPRGKTYTGIRGVDIGTHGKYRARITFQGKTYYLGQYENIEEAAKSRKRAEEEIFGNFLEWYAKEYPEMWQKIKKKKEDADGGKED